MKRQSVWLRRLAGALLIALVNVVGLGYTYKNWVMRDGLVERLVTQTWIPYLVLGAAVVAGLMLLGATPVRGARVSPWTLLPAVALSLGLCVATGTPIAWVNYKFTYWSVPFGAVYAYALLLWRFLCALFSQQGRTAPFDGRAALRAALIAAALYLPGLLAGLVQLAHGKGVLPMRPGWLYALIFLCSGVAGLVVVRRGRRCAGVALALVGAAGLALGLWGQMPGASQYQPEAGVLANSILQGAQLTWGLSAHSFCLFAGIKCLLPEKSRA